AEMRAAVAEVVEEFAADRPAEVKQALADYLTQVPAAIRRSLRRPADPAGITVAPEQIVSKAEDLLPFLPARLPRFKPGDRPLSNVDYELVELLGVGGFGEVWKARNPQFDSLPPVALKFCLNDIARDLLLRHEAAVLNQVMREGRHPGIVALQQSHLSAVPPCLAYEFVAGGDLTGLIRELHRTAKDAETVIKRSIEIMQELADIVAYAHQRKPPIVHRDLKPANILVERTADGKTRLRIADFGIGGVVARQNIEQTRVGTTQGGFHHSVVRGAFTPLYASPQQMRGEPPDPCDDVHALGVIWYQLLTGDLSVGRPGGTRWAKRLEEQGMTEEQLELLASCFEDNPAHRPADAAQLAERLREVGSRKRKTRKPTLQLDAGEAETFERFAAARAIYEEAKAGLDHYREAAQEMLWRKILQLWAQGGGKPDNQQIKVPGGRAAGQVQIKEVLKMDLPDDQSIQTVLLNAGFSQECVERIVQSEVTAETEVMLRSPAELAKTNPELAAKVRKVLQEALTPAEQEEAFVKTVTVKVKKGFLERATDYACSPEELARLFEIIRPQFTLTGVTYQGDLEKAFSEIRAHRGQADLEGAPAK
ncbi:MAG TPA: serine/threonine-protein kinase, partial [Gemmataceae bacterium]|nr:serine/threonine-protein kinase [Gemmataceae bacterium]